VHLVDPLVVVRLGTCGRAGGRWC